jgi:hypothetical protein
MQSEGSCVHYCTGLKLFAETMKTLGAVVLGLTTHVIHVVIEYHANRSLCSLSAFRAAYDEIRSLSPILFGHDPRIKIVAPFTVCNSSNMVSLFSIKIFLFCSLLQVVF